MRVSVIIPTFDRSGLLEKTLECLVSQDLDKAAYEVVVVDDGSSDDTEKVVRSFSKSIQVEYIRQWDKGFRAGAARNLGIAAATGEICLFLDTGILVGKNCLEAHISMHNSSKEDLYLLGVVHGFSQTNDDDERLKANLQDNIDETLKVLSEDPIFEDIREPVFSLVEDTLCRLPAAWCIAFTCLASIKRQRLLDVGMFDPNFTSWGGEDDDLAYRLIKSGVKISLNRAGRGLHYPHYKDGEKNKKSGRSNSLYMFEKYQDPIILEFINHGWFTVNRYN